MSNEKRPNTLLSYNFSSKKSEFDVYLIKIISFHFFVLIKNLISFFLCFCYVISTLLDQKSFGLSIKILPILPIVFSRYKRSLPIGLKILVTPLARNTRWQSIRLVYYCLYDKKNIEFDFSFSTL
jgi:hypothetical protein